MSDLRFVNEPVAQGFAEGFTIFLTVAGLDVLMRTSAGESKGRLSDIDANGALVGSMYEPGAAEGASPIKLSVTIESEELLLLHWGKRTWQLRKPEGKQHYFAFLNQWPAKAEPATSIQAMLAALKKK